MIIVTCPCVLSVGNGPLRLTILTPAAYQSCGPAPILPRYHSDKELSDMRAGSIHQSEGQRTPGSRSCPANSVSAQHALEKPPGRHLRLVRATQMRVGYRAWKSFLCSFLCQHDCSSREIRETCVEEQGRAWTVWGLVWKRQ